MCNAARCCSSVVAKTNSWHVFVSFLIRFVARSQKLNALSLYASELPASPPIRPGVAVFCVDMQSDSRYQWDYPLTR
jgi:hypothetical protein